jgi:hypothetical protein
LLKYFSLKVAQFLRIQPNTELVGYGRNVSLGGKSTCVESKRRKG